MRQRESHSRSTERNDCNITTAHTQVHTGQAAARTWLTLLAVYAAILLWLLFSVCFVSLSSAHEIAEFKNLTTNEAKKKIFSLQNPECLRRLCAYVCVPVWLCWCVSDVNAAVVGNARLSLRDQHKIHRRRNNRRKSESRYRTGFACNGGTRIVNDDDDGQEIHTQKCAQRMIICNFNSVPANDEWTKRTSHSACRAMIIIDTHRYISYAMAAVALQMMRCVGTVGFSRLHFYKWVISASECVAHNFCGILFHFYFDFFSAWFAKIVRKEISAEKIAESKKWNLIFRQTRNTIKIDVCVREFATNAFFAQPLHIVRRDEYVLPFLVTKKLSLVSIGNRILSPFHSTKKTPVCFVFAFCSARLYRREAIMQNSAKWKFSTIFTYRHVAATGWQKQRTPGIGTQNVTENDYEENWRDTLGNDRERERARSWVRIRMHEILLHFYGWKKCEAKIPRFCIGAHEAEDDYVDDNRQRPRWWW